MAQPTKKKYRVRVAAADGSVIREYTVRAPSEQVARENVLIHARRSHKNAHAATATETP